MTNPIPVYVKKRDFVVHVVVPERASSSVISTTTDNWVDSAGNQMVDSAGNTFIFNSGRVAYPEVIRVKKRSFVVRAKVNHG